MIVLGESRFANSSDGRTCNIEYTYEVVPMHRCDLPGSPVTAWRVAYSLFSVNPKGSNCRSGRYETRGRTLGARHAVRENAIAEYFAFAGKEWKE